MLAAMVASVSLMVAMAIMVASFRQSLDDWLTVMLPADLYVRSASDTVAFNAADRTGIERIPGVVRVEFMRATSIVLEKAAPRVTLLARDIDPRDPGARHHRAHRRPRRRVRRRGDLARLRSPAGRDRG
jgi:putative ABC transport system permease protein